MWKCAIAHVDSGRALAAPVSVAFATEVGALSGLSVLTVDGSDEARGDGGSLYRLLPTVVDRLRGFRYRGEELPASVETVLVGAMRRRLGDRGTAGSPLQLLHVVVSEPESVTGILNFVAQDGLRDVVVYVQQDLGYGPFDGATEADCSGDDVVWALCGHLYWPYEGPPATRWLVAALQPVTASRQTVGAGPAASLSPSGRLEALRRLSVDGLSAVAVRVLASAAPRLGCIRVIDGVTGSFGGGSGRSPPVLTDEGLHHLAGLPLRGLVLVGCPRLTPAGLTTALALAGAELRRLIFLTPAMPAASVLAALPAECLRLATLAVLDPRAPAPAPEASALPSPAIELLIDLLRGGSAVGAARLPAPRNLVLTRVGGGATPEAEALSSAAFCVTLAQWFPLHRLLVLRLSVDRGDSRQGWGGRLLGAIASSSVRSLGLTVAAASIAVHHTRGLRARLPRLASLWLGGAYVGAGVPPAVVLAGVTPTFVRCHIQSKVPPLATAGRMVPTPRFIDCDNDYEETETGRDGVGPHSD